MNGEALLGLRWIDLLWMFLFLVVIPGYALVMERAYNR